MQNDLVSFDSWLALAGAHVVSTRKLTAHARQAWFPIAGPATLVMDGDDDKLALDQREDDRVLEAIDEHTPDVDVFGARQSNAGLRKLLHKGEALSDLDREDGAELAVPGLVVMGGPGSSSRASGSQRIRISAARSRRARASRHRDRAALRSRL